MFNCYKHCKGQLTSNCFMIVNKLLLTFSSYFCSIFLKMTVLSLTFLYIFFFYHILINSGDIETNPGPSVRKSGILSVCHWNLNSLWVDDFVKVNLLSAFLSTHDIDILCLSETFLDSSIMDDDPRILINGYNLIRSDHPTNSKQGGVCIYYKDYLPLVNRVDLTNLHECLVCEIKFGRNNCFLTTLYRSPSQSVDQFALFKQQFEETITKINDQSPTISLFLGDYNARNSQWYPNDITNTAGRELGNLISMYGIAQIINEPTHILSGSTSCIDLVFTSSKNLITDFGVLPSLFSRCHHQIVFAKLNFKVFYPPVYERRIWDFSKADNVSIQKAISNITWEESLSKLNVDDRVEMLTNSILNVCSNFIPNRMIRVRDKDAPWMNDEIKQIILDKAKIYRRYVKNGRRDYDYQSLCEIRNRCKSLIQKRKSDYYKKLSDSLNDPHISPKKYWSVLHRFLNKRKSPQIPPIRHNNSVVTNVSEKANIFNSFFAKQCSLLLTDSIIPNQLHLNTNKRLDSVTFDSDKVLSIIRSLDVNKAHGWDNVSIRMLKICDETIVPPLINIFTAALNSGTFPSAWKRGNITPCFKKGDKSLVNNYRPVSLLPILGKILEKCIFDVLYSYFEKNKLFTDCQSGFRKGDSCVSQLLAIVHEIFKSFDASPSIDTRGIFLDISKAFDRVWHEGLVFKLQSYGISGQLLGLIKNFLSERLQRVVINGQTSTWEKILAGVPQGSILGPLLFLIYVNDLPLNIESNVKIFADDTSLFSKVNLTNSVTILNNDMVNISKWANQWKMSFNPDVTKQAVEVYFSRKTSTNAQSLILFNGNPVSSEPFQKHLGLYLDKTLSFDHHLEEKIAKVNKLIGMISRLRSVLPRHSLITIYKAFARPHLDYGDIIYDNPGNASFSNRLETIQYNAALAITGCIRGTSREKLYAEIGLESLSDRRYCRKLCFFYKIVNGCTPAYLQTFLPDPCIKSYATRTNNVFNTIKTRTVRYKNSFFPYCVSQWNSLDSELRELPSINSFKNALARFYRPSPSLLYHVHNQKGIIFLNRLRVDFSHLKEHKFRHNFQDTVDPFCNCSTNSIETTEHYLLRCSDYSVQRTILFDDLNKASISIFPFNSKYLKQILLFGYSNFSYNDNRIIITSVINFILQSKRFDRSLFE